MISQQGGGAEGRRGGGGKRIQYCCGARHLTRCVTRSRRRHSTAAPWTLYDDDGRGWLVTQGQRQILIELEETGGWVLPIRRLSHRPGCAAPRYMRTDAEANQLDHRRGEAGDDIMGGTIRQKGVAIGESSGEAGTGEDWSAAGWGLSGGVSGRRADRRC